MRIYILILSDIKSIDNDKEFSEIVKDAKWEWWRYTALTWILATPDNVSTNNIISEAAKCYGPSFLTVLEVSINDFGGLYPSKDLTDINPFEWFERIRSSEYKPRWEREKK